MLYPLKPREALVRIHTDSIAVDSRPVELFATGHISGAYSIPMGDSFGTWVGWLMEPTKPLVFVLQDPSDAEETVRQLIRIGYDDLEGYLDGGMEAWERAHLPVAKLRVITAADLKDALTKEGGPLPLDVRFGYEWRAGHVPGALHVELGEMPEHLDGLPRDTEYATLCATGIRATSAASLLEREGFKGIAVVAGGTDAWAEFGYPLENDPS